MKFPVSHNGKGSIIPICNKPQDEDPSEHIQFVIDALKLRADELGIGEKGKEVLR